MVEVLTEEELLFCETFIDPVAFSETLFPNFDNFGEYDEEKFGHVRNGQLPLLSYEYLIDEDPDKTEKENFRLLEGAGNIWCFGGRNFGKTECVLKLDMLISLILHEGWQMLVTSYDSVHIRGVVEPVIGALEYHPILSSFKERIKRSPSFLLTTSTKNTLEGINMNLKGSDPGSNFFQKHAKKIWLEEACVDGHTKIRLVNSKGEIFTKNISYLINSNLWKKVKVLSYNFKSKQIEAKKIKKVFKKQVKNYKSYRIVLSSRIGRARRTLNVSQKQKIWCNGKYKLPKDIKVGDELYLLNQTTLSRVQKEVLLGCLLGDAWISVGKSLMFTHGNKQRGYLEYKKRVFSNLFKNFRKNKNAGKIGDWKITRKIIFYDKKYKKNRFVWRVGSKRTNDLKEFVNFKYEKKNKRFVKINKSLFEKYFSDISLAFWYMDDGSVRSYKKRKDGKTSRAITLHTEGFDYETNLYFKKFFEKRYGVSPSVLGNKYYRLLFTVKDSEILLKKIKDYIYDDLLYKLKGLKSKFIDLGNNEYPLLPIRVESIELEDRKSWTMYDIEVEDNHNFFGNGLLISNSFETDEVYNKRIDSKSELGWIERSSGMTNFTENMPAGRIYFQGKKPWVLNVPQYINPYWDEEEKKRAIKKYHGEQSVSYRIFVRGEVVTEGISVFDMERVRKCYTKERLLKSFELSKEHFSMFKGKLIVERPKNAEEIYITADIGESAPTEISIFSLVNGKYKYLYNITLYKLTDKEQFEIFDYLISILNTEHTGIDTTDGTGRAIYRRLAEKYPPEKLAWVAFNERIPVGFKKDEEGRVVYTKDGLPEYEMEYTASWSVKRLKDLFYGRYLEIPHNSYKLDDQIMSVKAIQGSNRVIYECVSIDGDHAWQSFQVFAIAEWFTRMKKQQPMGEKKFSKVGV